jgi:HAD superfamily hydrolase (TIGR01484 family)
VKYKALILDLDGTTVASSGQSRPSTAVKNAVKLAQQHVKVAVATGRPLASASPVIQALAIEEPCVVNGGAEIIDPKSGEKLFHKYISKDKQKAVLAITQTFGVPLYTDFSQYKQPIQNKQQIQGGTAKLFIDAINTKRSIELLEELAVVEGISAHPTTSWTEGDVVDIHITDFEATKKHGIEELLKMLKVSKAEAIGIGDFHNDLPLLESVGLKIVMGSAPPEIQAIADHVVPDIAHDGVVVAIERFIIAAQQP